MFWFILIIMKHFPLAVFFSLPWWVQEGKILNFHLYSLKIIKDYKVRVSRQVDYLRQLENKVLSNLKQTTERDIVGCMGEHKYVKGEMRGVKFVVENEKSKKTKKKNLKRVLQKNRKGKRWKTRKRGKWGDGRKNHEIGHKSSSHVQLARSLGEPVHWVELINYHCSLF